MADTDDLMPDARDSRIAELEQQVEDLQDTVSRQRDTVDALQQTNQLLSEQLEEKCKQLESSSQQFLTSRGLNDNNQRSLSIDETSLYRKDSFISDSGDLNHSFVGCNAQSIRDDEDHIYSSGDDLETYKTKIMDDHELLPLKQGTLKKKSENMHRYNNRYVILYPSFLLYYDQCPIKSSSTRKNSTGMSFTKSKNSTNNEINHPKGTIYLRNYHVAIRKDIKKKRFDITFVPHQSAVQMGLAAVDARIRFRCKTLNELMEWTEKIRTAITSSNSGFIKYDVRTDYISNDLSNLGKATSNDTNNNHNDMKEDDSKDDHESEDNTKMFDINDLKEMMKREEELKNEISSIRRMISQLEQEKEALKTDLEIKTTEIESVHRVSMKRQKDSEAQMKDIREHEKTLKSKMESLRQHLNKLEQKQKEQHKKLKRYKHHEQDTQRNIEICKTWNKRLDENSLQYLGSIYPNISNKQLFENCQAGCIGLLEEIYENRKGTLVVENECKSNTNEVSGKKRKESKISQEIMLCFTEIFCKHIKTTINYASLQQAHNGVVNDFKLLKNDIDFDDGRNSLQDDALIMASMTASLF